MSHYIPVLLGTAREGRNSEKVAHLVLEELGKCPSVETELVDVREYLFSKTARFAEEGNSAATKWHDVALRAHAFVWVVPEYNRGYPGEFKLMLDALYSEYAKKPVAFVGVSDGALGGARVVEQLKLISLGLRMVPVPDAAYFPLVCTLFEGTKLIDDSYRQKVNRVLDSLLSYLA